MTDQSDIPISKERVEECLKSAHGWQRQLPLYADRQQFWADLWAISAGILASITGLAIFPVAAGNQSTWTKWIVSIVALASAISALMPRVKNYGEQAGSARVLAAQYGSVYGRLLDLTKCDEIPQHAAKTVLLEFQSTNEKKDALRGIADYRGKTRYRRIKRKQDDERDKSNDGDEDDKPPDEAAVTGNGQPAAGDKVVGAKG